MSTNSLLFLLFLRKNSSRVVLYVRCQMLWNWNWHSTVSELKSHGALALTFCNQSATGNCMHLKFLLVCPHHPIKVSLPRSRATDKLILSKLAATSSPRLCVHLKCTNCTAAQKGEVAALSCYPPAYARARIDSSLSRAFVLRCTLRDLDFTFRWSTE